MTRETAEMVAHHLLTGNHGREVKITRIISLTEVGTEFIYQVSVVNDDEAGLSISEMNSIATAHGVSVAFSEARFI